MFASGKGAGMGGKGKGGKGKGGGKNFEGGKGKGKGGSQLSKGCKYGKNGCITADHGPLYKTVNMTTVKMGSYTVDGKIGTIPREKSYYKEYLVAKRNADHWNTQGQGRLADEYEKKSDMILDGNFSGYEVPIRTEEFICKNRRF